MCNSKLSCAVVLGVCLGFVAARASAALVFSDPTPATSGQWAKVVDPAYPAAGLYVVNIGNSHQWYTASNYLITGFPHSHAAGVAWGVGSRYTGGSVTPSVDGAIETIDFSITTRKGSYNGVKVALLLMQNGKYYRSDFFTQLPGTATPEEVFALSGQPASAFGEFVGKAYQYGPPAADGTANFASNPDFSAGGSTIELGYLAHYDSALDQPDSPTAYQFTRAWSATVNFVPEPGAAGLLAGALGATLRRRSR